MTKPIRIAGDLYDAAVAIGREQSRSATEQVDYWVRVGRAVSADEVAVRQRRAALLVADLPEATAQAINAQIDADIERGAATTDFAAAAAARGVATVTLDEDGQLIREEPDGAISVITPVTVGSG